MIYFYSTIAYIFSIAIVYIICEVMRDRWVLCDIILDPPDGWLWIVIWPITFIIIPLITIISSCIMLIFERRDKFDERIDNIKKDVDKD